MTLFTTLNNPRGASPVVRHAEAQTTEAASMRPAKKAKTDPTVPPWSHIHALGVIATTGSFTLAAQRLGLSKAAVSQHLLELERSVGVSLVLRTTRSVRLTDAGRQLVDDTAAAFSQIEQTLSSVQDLVLQPRGRVRVSAPVALGRQHVAPYLADFLRAWPEVRIELDLSDRLINLPQEGFDLAVRHTSSPPDNHVVWKLCDSRTVLVASSAYLRSRGTPRHPAELVNHACLQYLRHGTPPWMFERTGPGSIDIESDDADVPAGDTLTGSHVQPQRVSVNVRGPLHTNNSEVLRDAVLGGLGIAQLPDFSAAAALKSKRLRQVLPDWRPVGFFGDAIYAMRPWSAQVPKAVQALALHLRGALAEGFAMPR